MSESNKTLHRKKALVTALEKCLGIVTPACKSVDIARSTHYQWMREDEDYAEQVSDLANIALDFAESKLHSQIKEGNTIAIIFFLKTQGKKRGYIERQEVDMNGTVKLILNFFPIDCAFIPEPFIKGHFNCYLLTLFSASVYVNYLNAFSSFACEFYCYCVHSI